MDRILIEERKYIVNLKKQIVATGCNVLLIQKSILRNAVNDLTIHFLTKKHYGNKRYWDRRGRFYCKTINAVPIPHIKQFTRDKLGNANLVEERKLDGERKVFYVTGCSVQSKTVSNLVRGSN